ncbi:MAG: hypothetical protein JJU00_16450 [Opitutales bacterium]|nr:hypothetical protein [Opitutales bacterium]
MTARQRRRIYGTAGKIGCFGKLLIFIVAGAALIVGMNRFGSWQERREEQRHQRNLAEAEGDLRAFAQEHLPELQRVIHSFEGEIERREAMLERLADDMRRLNREPGADPDYRRWSDAVRKMHEELSLLREKRADAFLAFRKFELNPDSSDDAEARAQRFRLAQDAANEGRETFERLLREAGG